MMDALTEKEQPSVLTIAALAALAERYRAAEMRVVEATAALQAASAAFAQVSEVDLPAALAAAGVSGFPLADGAEVRLVTRLDGRKLTDPEALAWVEENGGTSLIRTTITVDLDRGDVETARRLHDALKRHPKANAFKRLTMEENVNPQTLGAWVRELVDQMRDPPLDLLGVRRRTYATVGDRPKSVDLKGMVRR
jgi:hypothetical protein